MSVTESDQALFLDACHKVLNQNILNSGVGTLSEKTVHACMKNFYEPDINYQEINVNGKIADIFKNNEIIEIQTKNLGALRSKLNLLLDDYHITIVHPLIYNKWLYWIDPSDGTVSEKRKSPKKGTFYDSFYELYRIKSYLTHPHLHICLPLIDVEEYRLKNGWSADRKKGSTRYDRIPIKLEDELYLHQPGDYAFFIPDDLKEKFTVRDYAHSAGLKPRYAGIAIQILKSLNIIEMKEKKGRAYVYVRNFH